MTDSILSVSMQRSCCSLWCWAAVSSTITHILGSPVSQSEVFETVYGNLGIDCSRCCSDNCSNSACNLRADIGTVLAQLNLNYGGKKNLADVSYGDICGQINAGKPVAGVIQYLELQGEHYLLIVGHSGTDSLTIGDPVDGHLFAASYSAYLNAGAYIDPSPNQLHGTWTAVYFIDAI